jgi:amidohydrolase
MDASAVIADVVAWRRHLHSHPELSFHEHETSRFVAATLESFGGLELERPTPTSVVARLRGASPGRRLALRADIDALPITEQSGVAFVSEHDGVMHACGHDGHTAIMLGVARLLSGAREELPGEVVFLFQHAEETPPGGAIELVESGALEGVDAVLGCHLLSTLKLGTIGATEGVATAAVDTIEVTIRGHGGHAAFPHETIDPIAIAAQVIANLQHVVSRTTPPSDSVVVSVTYINGGTPESVRFGGTVRTFTTEARARTEQAIRRTLHGVTTAHSGSYELDYVSGYAPVVNDPELAALVRAVAGPVRTVTVEPLMAGEDFSAYLRAVPGCFFWVGAGGSDAFPHHHPQFAIDERAFPIAIETFIGATTRYLGDG